MKFKSRLGIELVSIVCTILICTLLLKSNKDSMEFNYNSWNLTSSKLLSIQSHCRNSLAVRKNSDSIELISADGDRLSLSIEDTNNKRIIKFERRSLTKIKSIIIVRNLYNISLDFKQASEGLPNQDLSLKALYLDKALAHPLAVLIDLSLSNPRLPRELDL